ncbi:hypothetical protein V8C42DRAFT_114397 [Trichoderma barbatum]
MFVRDIKRLSLLAVPIIVILYTIISFYRQSKVTEWISPVINKFESDQGGGNSDLSQGEEAQAPLSNGNLGAFEKTSEDGHLPAANPPPAHLPLGNSSAFPSVQISHQELFSVSTADKKYFFIEFGEQRGMNPNIIPHPTLENTWIVVAQLARGADEQTAHFTEIKCNAVFQDQVLRCLESPTALPVAPTKGGDCKGDLAYFNFSIGPHDARVLYGPDSPYMVFGSNSQFTCFGQFIQDFRELVDWTGQETGPNDFPEGTELQRPLPWSAVEKNWFPFWDPAGQMYIHYDVAPKRVFARVQSDGSASVNLAVLTEEEDNKCLSKYMPTTINNLESVHQASNSLKVTMCKRTDAICIADITNTFIFTIWQHKTFYNFHAVYEPYLMLFQDQPPFAMHAVSKRPIWIHGRQQYPDRFTSEMIYVTSIAWKSSNVKYHGYLDDELFIGFGIEDKASGAIDITAEELMSGLGLCTEA